MKNSSGEGERENTSMKQKAPQRTRPALYIVLFFLVFSAVSAGAQTADESAQSSGFFIGPLAEVLGYGRNGLAFGGGLTMGAGSGVAIGVHLLYVIDTESINILELAFFLRFYLLGSQAVSGPFVQATAGVTLFPPESNVSLPVEKGTLSVGLAAGWRFLLGNRWYIEPTIRAGYPYIYGAGVSAGFRL